MFSSTGGIAITNNNNNNNNTNTINNNSNNNNNNNNNSSSSNPNNNNNQANIIVQNGNAGTGVLTNEKVPNQQQQIPPPPPHGQWQSQHQPAATYYDNTDDSRSQSFWIFDLQHDIHQFNSIQHKKFALACFVVSIIYQPIYLLLFQEENQSLDSSSLITYVFYACLTVFTIIFFTLFALNFRATRKTAPIVAVTSTSGQQQLGNTIGSAGLLVPTTTQIPAAAAAAALLFSQNNNFNSAAVAPFNGNAEEYNSHKQQQQQQDDQTINMMQSLVVEPPNNVPRARRLHTNSSNQEINNNIELGAIAGANIPTLTAVNNGTILLNHAGQVNKKLGTATLNMIGSISQLNPVVAQGITANQTHILIPSNPLLNRANSNKFKQQLLNPNNMKRSSSNAAANSNNSKMKQSKGSASAAATAAKNWRRMSVPQLLLRGVLSTAILLIIQLGSIMVSVMFMFRLDSYDQHEIVVAINLFEMMPCNFFQIVVSTNIIINQLRDPAFREDALFSSHLYDLLFALVLQVGYFHSMLVGVAVLWGSIYTISFYFDLISILALVILFLIVVNYLYRAYQRAEKNRISK